MKKILIIRFSSIGDIVLTTPVIRMLKQQVSETEVHYLTKIQFAEILENNPYIDKLHLFSDNYKKTISELKNEKFDYIIDLHNSLRSVRIKLSLRVKSFTFNKLNFRKWLIVNFKINKLPKIHIVERYLKTIENFGIKNDQKGLDYFISETDKIEKKELPENFKNGYIVFAIGANHFTKRLPVEKIISICKEINYPIVISGGKSDQTVGEQIKNTVGENIFNACGKFTLGQSASLVQQADLLISHDTGLMHIGSAFGKNIISIWGNTVPDFGMYPYLAGKQSKVIEVENLKCRPCSKIGHKKCPKKHFKCMNDIDAGEIVRNVETIIVNNLLSFRKQ